MTILHIDFETYSACDLRSAGLANYAADPSTGVHCMAYAWDDGPIQLWTAGTQGTFTLSDDVVVYAHNAPFELAIWNQIMVPHHGWPVLKPEQVRCTMAMAYAMALPGALENVAAALGLEQRKDTSGKRIMLRWCQPRKDGTFWKPEDDPAQFKALCDYCCQDVEVERAITKRLIKLSPTEQKVWELDYKINQRGIRVDLAAIDQAIKLVEAEKKRLDAEMLLVTGCVSRCTEVALLVQWIRTQGVEVPGLAKADVLDALGGDLPDNVRRALELRKEAAKSSTAKLQAMKDRASKDGRVRGSHQYHGASTGRWAGRGVQIQNLPRPRPGIKSSDVEHIIGLLDKPILLDMMYGPAMDAVADSIRGMIIPSQGHDLIAVDFSAIEARVLPWLAGEQHVLDTFIRKEDIYKAAAGRIYGVQADEVTKDQRQIGKVSTLALGYGGGVGAFQAMARAYGITVEDDQAESIKAAWRRAHPAIVQFWYDLEEAAMAALTQGGTTTCGRIRFKMKGSFLWCQLPSGRLLCYPYPELRTVSTPWGAEKEALTFMTVVSNIKAKVLPDDSAFGTWKRISTYGGSLAENVTQAVARDLLAEAMIRLEDSGYEITAHIHDEAVIEIETRCDTSTLSRIEALMAAAPAWATGLPLAAEGWRGPRYRK